MPKRQWVEQDLARVVCDLAGLGVCKGALKHSTLVASSQSQPNRP